MERILVVAVVAAAVAATAASARSAVIETGVTPLVVTTVSVAPAPAMADERAAWTPRLSDMLIRPVGAGDAAGQATGPTASATEVPAVFFAGGGLSRADGQQALSM